MTQLKRSKAGGFTLIELMIAVAIIAVLAAIVYPSYTTYVTNSRRAAASACMTELAQFMERYYTTNLSYANAALPDTTCRGELATFYTFALVGTPSATAFSLTATPRGAQLSRDTKCGTLGLIQTGAKSETGTGSVADCW